MFRKNRRKCLDCERSDGRTYRKSDIGKAKSIKWHEDNVNKHNELQAKWYQKNKKRINSKNNARYHNVADKTYKIKQHNKSTIHKVLASYTIGKYKKSAKPCKWTQCTHYHLCKWLKANFDESMSFDNFGKHWSVDHVIPIDKFDLNNKEEMNMCFHWTNTRPETCKYNMKKKSKIDKKQLQRHIKSLSEFCKKHNIKQKDEYFKLCATHLDAGTSRRS